MPGVGIKPLPQCKHWITSQLTTPRLSRLSFAGLEIQECSLVRGLPKLSIERGTQDILLSCGEYDLTSSLLVIRWMDFILNSVSYKMTSVRLYQTGGNGGGGRLLNFEKNEKE